MVIIVSSITSLHRVCVCQVTKRHYETALASFRPSGGRGMQEWREVVPEILHPLIDHDRKHLVDIITRRCPWLLPNKVKRGSVTVRPLQMYGAVCSFSFSGEFMHNSVP